MRNILLRVNMPSLLILTYFLSAAVAGTIIAYVIGRATRTVTSSVPAVITKETACQAGKEQETGFG